MLHIQYIHMTVVEATIYKIATISPSSIPKIHNNIITGLQHL